MDNIVEMKVNYNIVTNELFIDDKLVGIYSKQQAADEARDEFYSIVSRKQIENIIKNACCNS